MSRAIWNRSDTGSSPSSSWGGRSNSTSGGCATRSIGQHASVSISRCASGCRDSLPTSSFVTTPSCTSPADDRDDRSRPARKRGCHAEPYRTRWESSISIARLTDQPLVVNHRLIVPAPGLRLCRLRVPDHPVAQVGRERAVPDRKLLESDPVRQRIEEPHTAAEEIRGKVDQDLVAQPGGQRLLPG